MKPKTKIIVVEVETKDSDNMVELRARLALEKANFVVKQVTVSEAQAPPKEG